MSGNLPPVGNVNSIRQDPVNKNLLFAPTEIGFYISLNDGQSWTSFMPGLPTGRADEVLVHPREHDLILATHSRSIWILDDISPLEQMTAPAGEDATLLKPRDAVIWKADRRNVTETPGDKLWEADPAPRGTAITYTLKAAVPDAKITITDTATGQATFSCVGDSQLGLQAGLNRVQWPLVSSQQVAAGGRGFGARAGGPPGAAAPGTTPPGPTACSAIGAGGRAAGFGGGGRGGGGATIRPGVYRVTLTVGGKDVGSQTFNVIEDVWLNER